MFTKEKVIECCEVYCFRSAEQHTVEEVNSGVEANCFHHFSKSAKTKGLEEGFKQLDELSDLASTLQEIGKAIEPCIGVVGMPKGTKYNLSRSFSWKFIGKGVRFKKHGPVDLRYFRRLAFWICMQGMKLGSSYCSTEEKLIESGKIAVKEKSLSTIEASKIVVLEFR